MGTAPSSESGAAGGIDRGRGDAAWLERARAAWPGVALDEARFARHVRERGVAEAYVADAYIARACADGVPGAVQAFERAYAADVARVLRRIDASPAFVDEAMQVLREKLLVGRRAGAAASGDARDGERPKIADYAGRSSLRSWLGVAATRTALNLRRGRDARGHDALPASDAWAAAAAATAAPDVAYMKERYAHALADALRAALAGLTPRERTLLRLHFASGLTVDRLGAMYRVGRSTAARRLAAARARLVDETRRVLCAELRIDEREAESVVAFVRSRVDVSLGGLFAESATGGEVPQSGDARKTTEPGT